MRNVSLFTVCFLIICFSCVVLEGKNKYYIKKIWDNENHCAFTSIVKFKGKYYCSFREADSHIFDEAGNAGGMVRIISSKDGNKWESVVLIRKPTFDFRDPKLSITPDGKLMVIIGGSIYKEKVLEGRVPHVSFSLDGKHFSEPIPINLDEKVKGGKDWIWRVTWDADTGYGVNFSLINKDEAVISLMKTTDGLNYELVTRLNVPDFPNESTIRILPDKRMLIMIRRERGDQHGYWGVSEPPYQDWKWTKMEMRLGGPDFISIGEIIIAGTRSHFIPSFPKTVLLRGDDKGRFQEVFLFPSGGDTSYPGFLIEGDYLWVSYYSTHETEKSAIYLAKLPLSFFKTSATDFEK